MAKTPELISATEGCEILRIDRSTLTRMIQRGEIEVFTRLGSGAQTQIVLTRSECERVKALRDQRAAERQAAAS